MYSDISPSLVLDISVNDEGLGELGPADGEWVVFLTAPGGHEAEFTVDRLDDGESDAELLAEAVADAVSDVLYGDHIFLRALRRAIRKARSPLAQARGSVANRGVPPLTSSPAS
jgi:hypothetical protein